MTCQDCGTKDAGRWIGDLCSACYQRRWHAAHPGYRAESLRSWRARNPEYVDAYNAARRAGDREKTCPDCGTTFRCPANRRFQKCRPCRRAVLTEGRRRREYRRLQRELAGDLRPVDIRRLFATAPKRCPLCQHKMHDAVGHPHKAQLDHIVPLGVGGSHSITNVRVICARCNQARPKDGSDLMQEPLWARVA